MSALRLLVLTLCVAFAPVVNAQSGMSIFNPAALLIVFREVLEGCVVVSVMLSALHRVGAHSKKRWVWIGALVGIFCSIIIGVAFIAVFWAASQDLFSGNSDAIFGGTVAAFGSVMVTFVALKMLKFSGLQAKWEAKLKSRGSAIHRAALSDLSPEEMEEIAGSNLSIFLLSFTTVVREGIETALFVGGVGAAAEWRSLPLPALVGAVFGLLGGFLIVYGGRNIDNMAIFFYASCIFMLFIAAGLTMTSAYEFESIYSQDALMDGSVVIGTPLWSLKYCCDETVGFFSVFRGILGWRDSPTFVMAVAYLSYWIFVTTLMWYRYAKGTLFTSKWNAQSCPDIHSSGVVEFHDIVYSDGDSKQRDASAAEDSTDAKVIDAIKPADPAPQRDLAEQQEISAVISSEAPAVVATGTNMGSIEINDCEIIEVADGEDALKPAPTADAPAAAAGIAARRGHLWFVAGQAMLWSFLIAVSCVVGLRAAKGVRLYYIGVAEVEWDYAPTGRNGLTGNLFTDPAESDIANLMVQTDKFEGRKYLKSQFIEYTDKTFKVPKPVPDEWAHKGIVGPIIRAAVGDSLRAVFYNGDPDSPYSLNPRGVMYDKADEGVRYRDGSRRRRRRHLLYSSDSGSLTISGNGPNQLDDVIPVGGSYIYDWEVPERAGPGPNDPSSVVWSYQSNVNWEFDLFSGLFGAIIVTARGKADAQRKPVDVDKEFVAVFLNVNEDESNKAAKNQNKYTPKCTDACHYGDDAVVAAQLKCAINGYMFDNVPGITMNVGDRVRWYLLGLGNEGDLHAVYFHGNTVLHQGHRKQTIELMAGTTAVADMVPDKAGRFQFEDSIYEHLNGGQVASYLVQASGSAAATAAVAASAPAPHGNVRQYYIAVEESEWDYAPTGANTVMPTDGMKMGDPDADYFAQTKYGKARFVEYTDGTFETVKPRAAEWEHMGVLGPVIRAQVGDVVQVALWNRASRPCSLRPQGLLDTQAEGFTFRGQVVGDQTDAVQPGVRHDYVFGVPERAGPGAGDGSSVAWLYYSDVDHEEDINAGLVGAIIVARNGTADANGKPTDVDKEFVTLFSIFDENNAWSPVANQGNESNRKYSINGYIYGNNEFLTMNTGQKVRWYIMDVGDVVSLHTAHFHASTVIEYGRRTDVIAMLPSTSYTVDAVADSVGKWLLHCHVSRHMANGMIVTVRSYYIAAEEVWWDYAPSMINTVTGLPFSQDPGGGYMVNNATRVGHRSLKARYIEYMDETFTSLAPIPPEWAHKGLLGPVMRAEVGDEIQVVFWNRCSRAYTMHPHGVEYLKPDEGADYNDGISITNKPGSAVPPGGKYTYRWIVPDRAGPGPNDPATVPWLYHSHVDESADVNSGLVGMLLVSRAGAGPVSAEGKVGKPDEVDQEMVLFFKVIDEALSWYADFNIRNLTDGVEGIKARCLVDDGNVTDDIPYCDSFAESLKRHSINCLMYGNNPDLIVQRGKRVRWYAIDLGTDFDMHGATWNGATLLNGGVRKDQVALMPASMSTLDMVPDMSGKWLLRCAVSDHFLAGMVGMYEVQG